jgi:hypothetical protein
VIAAINVSVEVNMKGVKHYLRNGKEHKGSKHKMPNGVLHTGIKHNSNSKRLYHFSELSKTAQLRAKGK